MIKDHLDVAVIFLLRVAENGIGTSTMVGIGTLVRLLEAITSDECLTTNKSIRIFEIQR